MNMPGQFRGMLRPGPSLNVVFDGNSLTAGGQGSQTINYPQMVFASPPIQGSGAGTTRCGIAGQTWRMMNGLDGGSVADADGSWVSGKYNVLVCWETVNSYGAGRSVAQCAQDCIDYIKARKALHPWRVILLTCLPIGSATSDVALQQWNALARANYRAWGADLLVDVRAFFPFNFNGDDGAGGINAATFQARQQYYYETSAWLHLTQLGYQCVADLVCAALRRLPKKAP